MDRLTLLIGDAQERLADLPAESVQMCVTSPPYFGLRDYGVPGQVGQEDTPEAYVARLVAIFREVRRVLRKDGTLWLNLGDSYARTAGDDATRGTPNTGQKRSMEAGADRSGLGNNRPPPGLKPKDLIGTPWRVAFALQADGWYLRQDIIWHKPNPMPESVKDRCTRAHEYLFMLSKNERYFYDGEAVKEPCVNSEAHRFTDGGVDKQRGHSRRHAGFNGRYAERIAAEGAPTHRNRRSVWTIATRPYKGAHFATFPPALIEPCILAGSRPGDTVLDPFLGSGTTAQVALAHGRFAVGIELNLAYEALIRARVAAA